MTKEDLDEIIRRHDPIGLIRMGAPNHEYSPEAGTIFPRLQRTVITSPQDVLNIVYDEFCAWFSGQTIAGHIDGYRTMSEEIYSQMERR